MNVGKKEYQERMCGTVISLMTSKDDGEGGLNSDTPPPLCQRIAHYYICTDRAVFKRNISSVEHGTPPAVVASFGARFESDGN